MTSRNSFEWISQFNAWASPPGDTEDRRCERAVQVVKNAVAEDSRLSARTIEVFAQGSYRNGTNVPQESDVDVCVLCRDTFWYEPLPSGATREGLGIAPATYEYEEFKNDVHRALVNYLGKTAVRRGNKAFDVHETSYHVDADVVACFENRRYGTPPSPYNVLLGTTFFQDGDGERIINWPQQQYENGVQKNKATGGRFKKVTRVLKSLRYEMEDAGFAEARNVPSFLIECLAWNVTSLLLNAAGLATDVHTALRFLEQNTNTEATCAEWGEVSELKYLFRSAQPWTRDQANRFVGAAARYLGV